MKLDEHEVDRRVHDAIQFVGLDEHMLELSPFELSGGQKRRVAIAGVIAMEPSVLILDEPTAGLDPAGSSDILSNLEDYHQRKNATIILVSHSMEEVARSADRLVVVNGGEIPFSGSPKEVFSHAAQLEEMGLGLPAVTRIFHRLKELGSDVDPSVFTTEQAATAILNKLGRGNI
jgi:energy-coupling factor transport system ATP-binding protein